MNNIALECYTKTMIFWLILIVEFLILFFTSKYIYMAIFETFMRIFKSQNLAIIPIFILFLPGVIIHELAHFLAAELLFVKAHDLEVAPKITHGSLQMGSVRISETDIVRRAIIGVSPVILGSTFLFAVLFYFINNINLGTIALVIWITFFVTNTMFSSKRDIEGALELSIFILFLGLVLAIFTMILKIDVFSPTISFLTAEAVIDKVKLIAILFSIPVGLNVFIYVLSRALLRKIP